MPTHAPFTDERGRAPAQLDQFSPANAGAISRLFAFFIDVVVMVVASVCATHLIAWTAEFFRLDRIATGQRLVDWGSRLAVASVTALYLPLSWTLTGQSLGKLTLGLRVVRNDPRHPEVTKLSLPRSFLRGAGYWLSALPFGLGFLCAAFDEERRTLHDRLAGTRVLYQPRRRRR
jgi:uncharacterized RDD family membrane protein YckC